MKNYKGFIRTEQYLQWYDVCFPKLKFQKAESQFCISNEKDLNDNSFYLTISLKAVLLTKQKIRDSLCSISSGFKSSLLQIYRKFTGEPPSRIVFSIKLHINFIKITLLLRSSPVILLHFF